MGSEYAPVGVLLGDQSLTICKQPIYSAHYLSMPQLQAALQDSSAQVRRPTRGGGGAGDDKRGGLATFRRGDCVVYTGATSAAAGPAEEVVFGVMNIFHRKQQYRYLITFDGTREEFSITSWTVWRRVPAAGVDLSNFDPETSNVKVCDDETKVRMCAQYTSAPLTSMSLDTLHKDSSLGPARERAAREAERKEKGKQQRTQRKATAALKAAAEKEAAEAARVAAKEEAARAAAVAASMLAGAGRGGGVHCRGNLGGGGGGMPGSLASAAPQGLSPSPPALCEAAEAQDQGAGGGAARGADRGACAGALRAEGRAR